MYTILRLTVLSVVAATWACASYADTLQCANANGDLVYFAASDTVGSNVSVGEDIWTYQGAAKSLQVEWDESSRVVIDESRSAARPTGEILYVQRVHLASLPQASTSHVRIDLSDTMLCRHLVDATR